MNKKMVIISTIVLIIDQITKSMAQIYSVNISLIGNFFRLSYYQNTGAAWSILEGRQTLLIVISLIMLVICAINKAPTFTTTVISGCAWLIFDFLFAYAIKNKWTLLFDECSTGRVSLEYHKTETQRRKDNWQGNVFKFTISIAVLVIHVILLFYLLK